MNSDPRVDDSKLDYNQMMKRDLTQLVDALDLDDLSKQFIKSRWLEQLLWLEYASKKNQTKYYLFRLSCIIGGVTIPALVTLNECGKMDAFVHPATIIVSLIVAVSAAIEEFLHFGERWRHYRRTAELLKGEGWSFFQRIGQYRKFDSHAKAYPEFAGRVEDIFQKEVAVFITKVTKEKEDGEKSEKV